MRRRQFLLAGMGALFAGLRPALAQTGATHHDMHKDMPGMKMPDAGGPAGEIPELPEGEPLLELPRLANESSDTGTFRARLTAAPATRQFVSGLDTPILAYNGSTPGPVVEVTEGDSVEITFENRLPSEESTIHWHGLPVPADQDGSPMHAVPANGSLAYTFRIPEGSAGSYWYHPHPHGLSAAQVYRGLAGAFLVRPKVDPIPAAYGDTLLMFTDLRLAPDGSMPASTMTDLMNGRVGDHILVNGRKNPVLAVQPGTKRRLRLLNATNARFLRLAFDNAEMTLIGTDGGLIEEPVRGMREVFLAPAERCEIIAHFEKPGMAVLRTLSYERGWMGADKPDEAGIHLFTVTVSGEDASPPPPLPDRLRTIPEPEKPAERRRLTFSEMMSMGSGGGMEMAFLINGQAFDMKRVDIVSKVGQAESWEIVNQSDMDHPFHIHGTQFQVVEKEFNGRVTRPPFRAWKDTVNVKPSETVRLVLRQDQPGLRMYHCHILEHEDLGMMGMLDVKA